MNKQIILSLSILAAVASIVVGATSAYFSDQEVSTGNTVSAATLDLTVNDQNAFSGAIITAGNLMPGESGTTTVAKLSNSGTREGLALFKVLTGTSTEGLDSESECVAEGGNWTNGACLNRTLNENICSVISYAYCYDINHNNLCDLSEQNGTVTVDSDINLGLLSSGAFNYLRLTPTLSAAAGNEYQGDSCATNIEFKLQQQPSVSPHPVSPAALYDLSDNNG